MSDVVYLPFPDQILEFFGSGGGRHPTKILGQYSSLWVMME